LLRGARVRTSVRQRPRLQPGLAQHPGEVRLPVERRRAAPLRGIGFVDPGRLLPPLARGLVVAEELGQLDETDAVSVSQKSSPPPGAQSRAGAGAHNHRPSLFYKAVAPAF